MKLRPTAAAAGFLCALAALQGAAPRSGVNVLIVTIDTLRPDRLGCYGGTVETPVIDGLARRGVLFTRAFAHTTTTLPSHTNIMLGWTPLAHGVHDNANFLVSPAALTIAEHLKSAGYETAAFIGGFPLDSRFGLDQGFDVYNDDLGGRRLAGHHYTERKAGAVVGKALQWLRSRQGDAPWFLWVHCFDPHDPYVPPEPFAAAYRDRPYDGEVASVDAALRALFDHLQNAGGADATVIVLTADHGESLGEHGEETHGFFAYNSTLHIPLILAAPGLKPRRTDEIAAHMDIFPTVCELLRIDPPPGLPGLSLRPAALGRRVPARDIYFESLYPHYSLGWAPLFGSLRADAKYIESPLPELYDERADFAERHNLAGERDLAPERARLAALTEAQAAPAAVPSGRLDRRSRDALRSLGYLSGLRAPAGASGAEIDVKVLLPFHNRVTAAGVLYDRGSKAEAIDGLRAVLVERPDFDPAYTRLAAIYKREKRMAEALALLESGVKARPDSLLLLSNYLTFLNEAGRYVEVIRLVVADGAYPLADRAESWNDLGFAFMNSGEPARAAEAFAKALELDPQFAVVHQNLGALAQAAFLRSKSRADYRAAVDHYRMSLEIDPGDVWAFFGLGMVYLQAGAPREAARCFERVLPIHPDYAPALYNLGMAWYNAGEWDRALAIFLDFRERFRAGLKSDQRALLEAMIQKCRPR